VSAVPITFNPSHEQLLASAPNGVLRFEVCIVQACLRVHAEELHDVGAAQRQL